MLVVLLIPYQEAITERALLIVRGCSEAVRHWLCQSQFGVLFTARRV